MGRGEWKRLSVSEIAEINPRRQVRIGETVPFVEMAAIRTDLPHVDYVSEREAKGSGSRFTNGDTLFARITPCTENGKTSFVDYLPDGSVGMGSTEFIVLGPRRDLVEPKYLYWLARSELIRKPAIANMIGTSGRQRVPTRVFDEITVPVPPIEVQQRTTEILDSVDEAIKSTRAVIEQTRKVKQGMLQKLLTRGIGHTRFKQTEIGEVPEGWRVVRLKDVATIVRGSSPRPAGDPRYFNGGYIPWITVKEATRDENVYMVSTETCLTEAGARHSRRLVKGTLVLTNSGATLGVPKILALDGCANDGIAAFLHISDDAFPLYLYYTLQSLTDWFRDVVAPGLGQPNLNTTLIGETRVPLPGVPEQREIATALFSTDNQLQIQRQHLECLTRLRSGLMQELFGGHRCVGLVG